MMRRACLAAFGLSFLTACGGGSGGSFGGGGVGSTPTPPPAAATNASLTNLTVSETFADVAVGQAGALTAAGTSTSRSAFAATDFSISYDAAAQSYTVREGGTSATYGPTNRPASTSAVITTYQRGSGTNTDSLVLFRAGAGNTTLALTYASYGAWQRLAQSGSGVDVRQNFFVYGVPTAASYMPRTGSATYQTTIDGFVIAPGASYALGGTGSFSADFGAGTVATSLTLNGTNVANGGSISLGSPTGSGAISGSSFGGSFSNLPAGRSGGFNGQFFGPGATEMGAVFTLSGDIAGNGAIVGKR